MGKRINQPACGSWFVPGGRIRKGEDIGSAHTRISDVELGVNLRRADGRLIGVFDHRYDTNFANAKGISTQYVVVAYEYCLAIELRDLPLVQHSEWRWFSESESGEVHRNSATYFQSVNVQ